MDINALKNMEPLFGSWFIDSMIGESQNSKVYRLRREKSDMLEYAVLKVIHIPAGQDDIADALSSGKYTSVKAFVDSYTSAAKAEAELLIRLKDNPNILSIYNYATIPCELPEIGCNFMLLTELLNPLSEGINAENADEHTIVRIGVDICRALEAIAACGTYHGEIKPENIFVDTNGNFKLGDFGFGREFTKQSMSSLSGYISPEVYSGQPASPSSDIYSLGILMYKFLNHNRAPFLPEFPQPISFADREIAIEKRMRGEIMLPPDSASAQLSSIILKACSYDPSDRYPDPSSFAHDLELLPGNGYYVSNDTNNIDYMPVSPINPNFYQPSTSSDNQDTMVLPENSFTPLADAVNTGRGTTLDAYESDINFDGEDGVPSLPQELPLEPDEQAETPHQKKLNGVALAIIILLCVLIVAGVIWIVKSKLSSKTPEETTVDITTTQDVETVKVPNFVNSPYDSITKNSLYTDNFSLKAEYVFDSVAYGLVIKQSVDADKDVEKGTEIILTVSKGQEKAVLINVVGKSYNEAYELLTQKGFTVTRKDVENDNAHIEDTVSSMSLNAGEEYDKGTAVILSVWGAHQTTTQPTTQATTAPTTSTTAPTTAPTTTDEFTTNNAFDSYGRQYYSIDNPQVSYTLSGHTLTAVSVGFNQNIGTNPTANGIAKIRVYLNGMMIQSLDAGIRCYVEEDNGNGLTCELDIDDEDFQINTDMYKYTVTFPEGAVTSDTGTNYGFSVEII